MPVFDSNKLKKGSATAEATAQLLNPKNTSDIEDKNTSLNDSDNGNNTDSDIKVVSDNALGSIDLKGMAKKLQKQRKPKFEETHTKDNVWWRNDVKAALDLLAKGRKGEKTRMINEAMIQYIQRLEKEQMDE